MKVTKTFLVGILLAMCSLFSYSAAADYLPDKIMVLALTQDMPVLAIDTSDVTYLDKSTGYLMANYGKITKPIVNYVAYNDNHITLLDYGANRQTNNDRYRIVKAVLRNPDQWRLSIERYRSQGPPFKV